MDKTRKRRRLSQDLNGDATTDPNIRSAIPESHGLEDRNTDTNKPLHRQTLFVRSLPPSATTETLTEFFSQSYPIKHATVVLDPKTKQSKGYGFVTFTDLEDAQQALDEFNGTPFDGRRLKIEVAEPRHRDGANEGDTKPADKIKEQKEKRRLETEPPKLIIRNLPFSITEPDQLAVLFRSFGKVKHAAVPKKGKSQAGFGFVVMRGKKNAEKAIESTNGKEVDGRMLAVDWAVEKNVWESLQKSTENAPNEEDSTSGRQVPENETGDIMEAEEESNDGSHDDDLEDLDQEDADVSMSDATEPEDNQEDKEDERNASTVFIRNLPFTATDESLYEHFLQFGPLRYARVVVDYETERPRGTAFVCFRNVEDAISCIRGAPKRTDTASENTKDRFKAAKHSVLEDENKDPSGQYTMDGRVLQISAAVSKEKAAKLEAEGHERRDAREKDKRRLYLLPEGTIPKDSPLYSKLSPSEVNLREASTKQRQTIVKSNPMLHMSLTRLSVRNIPRNVDTKALKALAREAVVGFAKDVKNGLRQPLSKEELGRDTEEVREADRLRKKKGKGIVKQAKIVFEGRDGAKISETSGGGRSRGYGFIEYTSHRWALMGLRWLNGHAVKGQPSVTKDSTEEKHKRLIVEFAIENAQVVKRRQEHQERSRMHKQGDGQNTQQSEPEGTQFESAKANGKQGKKRKRTDSGQKGQNAKKPVEATTNDKGSSTEKNNEIAKRNRIIAKKRMMRKARK